jgi:hypothetical protein
MSNLKIVAAATRNLRVSSLDVMDFTVLSKLIVLTKTTDEGYTLDEKIMEDFRERLATFVADLEFASHCCEGYCYWRCR